MHIRLCLTNLDLYLPDTISDPTEYLQSCGFTIDGCDTHLETVKCFGHCYPCHLGLCAEIDGRPVQFSDTGSSKQQKE